jgi:ATP adenylyltransferase
MGRDALWAPWRLEYICGEKPAGCFLCDALASDEDRRSLLLRRGETCAVIMNRYPYNNGHLLVFPNRHIRDLGEMTREERAESMDLVCDAVEALRATMRPEGFNVGVNLGRAAGAGLEGHVHTHIVPRWNGDTNFMPVLADTKVIPQALADLRDRIHPVLNG